MISDERRARNAVDAIGESYASSLEAIGEMLALHHDRIPAEVLASLRAIVDGADALAAQAMRDTAGHG